MTLGQRLREARERLKKNQADVAADLEKTQPTVVAWERDQAVPSLRDLRKLSWAYGVPIEELLACEIPDEPTPRTKRKSKPKSVAS